MPRGVVLAVEMVRVEVPEAPATSVMLAGVKLGTVPGVEIDVDRVMTPARALRLVSVISDVPLAP